MHSRKIEKFQFPAIRKHVTLSKLATLLVVIRSKPRSVVPKLQFKSSFSHYVYYFDAGRS